MLALSNLVDQSQTGSRAPSVEFVSNFVSFIRTFLSPFMVVATTYDRSKISVATLVFVGMLLLYLEESSRFHFRPTATHQYQKKGFKTTFGDPLYSEYRMAGGFVIVATSLEQANLALAPFHVPEGASIGYVFILIHTDLHNLSIVFQLAFPLYKYNDRTACI